MNKETARLRHVTLGAVLVGGLASVAPAFAEGAPAALTASPEQAARPDPAQPAQTASDQPPAAADQPTTTEPAPQAAAEPPAASGGGTPDIFSKNTLSLLMDFRLGVSNGGTSFVNGGFGKTRFQGNDSRGYQARVAPFEVDLLWNPRFTSSLSANVSAAWQRDHEDGLDLMEAYLNYLPAQTGKLRFSGRLGLMWPEISLENSTGGAWSVVNTITPSAINSWVGEEVKVLGAEGTVHTNIGEHDFGLTGGVFGWNDTSGTLLSYRGWALQDTKATALGYFNLPPLNNFIKLLQADRTQNTVELDKKAGWYARVDWHPPWPFGLALFYYDNNGNPEAFTAADQWGWRTRFWNLGLNANVTSKTKILAQGMIGSTIMGFPEHGQPWIHTDFQSAYLLGVHDFGRFALTGRIEAFQTREHGSEMPPTNSEDGWAATVAARVPINDHLTAFAEALNVSSRRRTRVDLGGLPSAFESQTVFQFALRAKL